MPGAVWTWWKRFFSTLRMRLALAILLAVTVILAAASAVDYYSDSSYNRDVQMAALREHAIMLAVARTRLPDKAQFAGFVQAVSMHVDDEAMPSHHILVLAADGKVLAYARQSGQPDLHEAMIASQGHDLVVGKERLTQVRIHGRDGTTYVVAQSMGPLEKDLMLRLLPRQLVIAAASGLGIFAMVYVLLSRWMLRPLDHLRQAGREWAREHFALRGVPEGPLEMRELTVDLNAMAQRLQEHRDESERELERARQIQAKLLPRVIPTVTGLRVAAGYQPAGYVAGDLYDVFDIAPGRTAVAVLDVCGHGISAALLTGVVKMSLHHRLSRCQGLIEAVEWINRDLLECVSEGQYVTACIGLWERATGVWRYVGAGHPGGVLLAGREWPEELPSTGPVLGMMVEAQWEEATRQLRPGNRLFLYTDGVIEAGGPEGLLDEEELSRLLHASRGFGLEEQVNTIMQEVRYRGGENPRDDSTMVAMEVLYDLRRDGPTLAYDA